MTMPGSCSSGLRSRPSAAAGSSRSNGLEVSSMNSRKPTRDQAHHGQHARHEGRGQGAAEVRHRDRPDVEHQHPQQQRAFVAAPDGGECGSARAGPNWSSTPRKAPRSRCARTRRPGRRRRRRRATHCSLRRRARQRHPVGAAALGAGHRQHRLHQRDGERQDQGEVAEFGNHLRSPATSVPAILASTCLARLTASAASGGM